MRFNGFSFQINWIVPPNFRSGLALIYFARTNFVLIFFLKREKGGFQECHGISEPNGMMTRKLAWKIIFIKMNSPFLRYIAEFLFS